MALAAKFTDITSSGGNIIGPSVQTVLIEGKAACVSGDQCTEPSTQSVSTFLKGSTSVFIGGRPAIRVIDPSSTGSLAIGASTVNIGD